MIFKIKCGVARSYDKFKARLLVKEFTQLKGLDHEEIFSPVVRIVFICLIMALVTQLDLELFQTDVKTTFFNRNFEEEI